MGERGRRVRERVGGGMRERGESGDVKWREKAMARQLPGNFVCLKGIYWG